MRRKVKVYKKSKNENSFRTPIESLDSINSMPIVGQGFLIGSSTHESGGIYTSDVELIESMGEEGFLLYTHYSIYKIVFIA